MTEILPKNGDRIRYRTKTAVRGFLEEVVREGIVQGIWGNGWDGPHISTDTGHCIPSLGDSFEILPSGASASDREEGS